MLSHDSMQYTTFCLSCAAILILCFTFFAADY